MRLLRLSLAALLLALLVGIGWYGLDMTWLAQPTTPTLSLIAPVQPQPPTEPIDIELAITEADSLGGFELDLVYDPAFVTVIGMTMTTFLGEPVNCNPDATRCSLHLGPITQAITMTSLGGYSYGSGNGADGNGVLAILQLMPTGAVGSTYLNITRAQLADTAGNPNTPFMVGTTLTLAEPTITPVPPTDTPTPTDTHTPTSTFTPTVTGTYTPTASPTHTATPTFTPTPPPIGHLVYLPAVLKPATTSLLTQPPAGFKGFPSRLLTDDPNTDVNGDGFTDIADIEQIAAVWGAMPGDPDWNPAYDFDQDGVITDIDVATVAADWRVPNIFDFSPDAASVGTLISIAGSNFIPVAGDGPVVTLNQVDGGTFNPPLMGVTAGGITFTASTEAATGPVTVTVGVHTIVTEDPLTIIPAGDFTIGAAPATVRVIQGQSVNYAISLFGDVGFTQLAQLNVSGYPAGTTAAFDPPYLATGQTSMLSLTVPITQTPVTSTLFVTATANVSGITVTHSATLTLQVEPVSTAFLARAVIADPQQSPLAGVTVTMLGRDGNGVPTGCTGQTVSDAAGNITLTNLPPECAGGQLIRYDGLTVMNQPGDYAGVDLFYALTEGQVTVSPVLIHLPRIDDKETVMVQQNAPFDQHFALESIPNLTVTVYANTTFTLLDGSQPDPFPLIAIEVPVDRLPDTMPPNDTTIDPFIVAFQPANATASQPVAVSFPNLTNIAPGTNVGLSTLDPTKGVMVMYGTGTVSADGTRIIPDLDPAYPGHRYGLVHFDWHGPVVTPSPLNPCPDCPPVERGDPVDLSSGLFVLRNTDIAIEGARGRIAIERIYRSSATIIGPFGMGASHNYDYRLNSSALVDANIGLIMPDGSEYPFVRQSNGTYINSTVPKVDGAVLEVTGNQSAILRWKDGTIFRFVPGNFLTGPVLGSISDPNGNTITIDRNPDFPQRITRISDGAGHALYIDYNSDGYIDNIQDSSGRQVHYTYVGGPITFSLFAIEEFTDPEGNITRYEYSTAGCGGGTPCPDPRLLTRVIDGRGIEVAENVYDRGIVVQQIQADGGVYRFDYTRMNPRIFTSPVLQTVVTDPLGRQTTYRFNPQGFPIDVTDAYGQIRVLEREAGSNLLTGVSGNGLCPECPDPGVGDLHFTYNGNGNLLTITDALNQTTSLTYEPLFNRVSSIANPLGHTANFIYDARGNLLSATDENGHSTQFTYDLYGSPVSITDPSGATTYLAYDMLGNPVALTDPLGHTTAFRYDGLSRVVEIVDSLSRHSLLEYDGLDRITSIVDADGNQTRFTYDPVGNLLTVTDARNQTTTFTYNSRNRLVNRTTSAGKTETFSYDLNNNLTNYVDRRGQVGQFFYDHLNRLIVESYGENNFVNYAYDALSRLSWVHDTEGGDFAFTYDQVGRLLSDSGPFGTVAYQYDALGQITSREVTGNSLVELLTIQWGICCWRLQKE